MTVIQALVLGLVEGITEFLPISSTGHLILVSELMGLTPSAFGTTFKIVIQLGAILAVVWLYGRTLLKDSTMAKKVLVALVPTGLIGFLLYPVIKEYFLDNSLLTLWALGLGGLALIVFDRWHRVGDGEQISYSQALFIGFCQSLAIVPGVSRSAAAIVGAMALGRSRRAAVEFSFLSAIPVMVAASGFDLFKNFSALAAGEGKLLLIGLAASFFTALVAIKFLLSYVSRRDLTVFGVYRIALAALLLAVWG
ncbi:MAG: undecaprenyl-diphosphate phosphatase [Patescibacteria group bacterium]